MTSKRTIALFLVPLALASGCDDGPTEPGVVCPAILLPSVTVEIRDSGGNPAALGASVRLIGATDQFDAGKANAGDPLVILAGGNFAAGPMDIEISKPGFSSATVRNVSLPVGPCGVTSQARVEATLSQPPANSVARLK